ncbi:MAG: hypothetical protein KDC54_14535, partial [Lewinella sp.]|nr:hypothetical protein [Lewinella sp.]
MKPSTTSQADRPWPNLAILKIKRLFSHLTGTARSESNSLRTDTGMAYQKKQVYRLCVALWCGALWVGGLAPAANAQTCVNLPIPEDNCAAGIEVPLTISGVGNNLGSNVMLYQAEVIIDHNYRQQLNLYLQAPNGTEVELSIGNGFSLDDYGDPVNCPANPAIFASWSQYPISSSAALNKFVGVFQPEGDFSDFNGIDPNGVWKLRVCDGTSANTTGAVIYFNLKFETAFCYNNSGITKLYVDQDAAGANDGSSWTNAFTDLQDAINASHICTDIQEIWVAEGTYTPGYDLVGNASPSDPATKTFFLTRDVKIYGGF